MSLLPISGEIEKGRPEIFVLIALNMPRRSPQHGYEIVIEKVTTEQRRSSLSTAQSPLKRETVFVTGLTSLLLGRFPAGFISVEKELNSAASNAQTPYFMRVSRFVIIIL